MVRLRFLSLGVFFVLYACAGGDKNLDIALKKTQEKGEKKQSAETISELVEAERIPKVHWQKFFQATPDKQEGNALTQSLKPLEQVDDGESFLKESEKLRALGRFESAEHSARAAIRLLPDAFKGYLILATIYYQQNKFRKAIEVLAEFKERTDDISNFDRELVFKYRYILALIYIGTEQPQKGYDILSDLVNYQKDFAPGYVALAASYFKRGKIKVSEFVTQRGLERAGEDPYLLNLMGLVKLKQGMSENGMRWFDKALKSKKDFHPAMLNKARILIQRRELKSAEVLVTKALALKESYDVNHTLMGILLSRLGKHTEAKNAYETAILLNPLSKEARFNLGVLQLNRFKQPNEALRLFVEVSQISKKYEELHDLSLAYISELRSMRAIH